MLMLTAHLYLAFAGLTSYTMIGHVYPDERATSLTGTSSAAPAQGGETGDEKDTLRVELYPCGHGGYKSTTDSGTTAPEVTAVVV